MSKFFSSLTLFLFINKISSECPPGAFHGLTSDRCYKIFRTPTAFMDAENACVLLNGHLTSVINGFENSFLESIAKSVLVNGEQIWLGGSRLMVPGTWTWNDGKSFSYTNWAKGEPVSTTGNDCIAQGLLSGTWSASKCSLALPYICEVSPTSNQGSTCPAPPSCTQQPCICPTPIHNTCPDQWKYFNYTRECYYIGTAADWETARLYCLQLGGQLASIHSGEENAFIYDIGNQTDMWTGLNNYNGNWGWIDGTPLDYKNWDCLSCLVNGEHEHCQPDGPGNCCNCAHMGFICGDKSSAWDDEPCTTISNFVCKRSSTTN